MQPMEPKGIATSGVEQPQNLVFRPPPPGKVNRKQPCLSNGEPVRQIFKGQKGPTCIWYAFQILSQWAPLKSADAENANNIYAKFRKKCVELEKKQEVWEAIIETFAANSRKLDKEDASTILNTKMDKIEPKYRKIVEKALTAFCEQNSVDDFSSYRKQLLEEITVEIYRKLMTDFKIGQEHIENCSVHTYKKPWDKLQLSEKMSVIQTCAIFGISKSCGATRSNWHPAQPVEKLMREIKKYGPLTLAGMFSFKGEPIETGSIDGRTLLEWPEHVQSDSTGSNHQVVVVGAGESNGEGYVFYIDPCDSSNPDDLKSQKIYKLSYKKFQAILVDLKGERNRQFEGSLFFASEMREGVNNYAFRM